MDKLIQQTSRPLGVEPRRELFRSSEHHKGWIRRRQPVSRGLRKLPLGVGLFASKAVFVLILVFGVAWLVPGLVDSFSQRTLHHAAVHPDGSFVRTGVVANFTTPTKLVYRDRNGTRHLILADETGVNHFINDTLIYLDSRRDAIKQAIDQQVTGLLENAFSDSPESIARYADWYFEWGRSWYLLKEGAVGAVKGFGPNNVQGFSEASRNEIEAYLLRNFQRIVLKPEQRGPIIEAGVSKIFAEAHAQYLDTLTEIDERLQVFLRTYTHHLEVIDERSPSHVSLDWDAQKWKAPRYSVDDEAFKATFRMASVVGVSGLIAKTIGPAVERAIAQVFAATAGRIVVALYPQLVGTAVGTAVEPGAGTLAGWFVGAAGGVIVDYVFNWRSERLGRAEFEAASHRAITATKAEYSRAIQRDLAQAVDIWMDDTRAVVTEQRIERKNDPKS